MISNVPTASIKDTIGKVEKMLREDTAQWDTINYIYILTQSKLQGVISIKEILRATPTQKIADLMITDIVTARAHTDQERVVYLALKHNLKAVPIVDKDDRFLGTVPSDIILEILNKETAEDILHSAGIQGKHDPAKALSQASAFTHLRKRLPWLILGIIGGLGAAVLIDSFEQSLRQDLLLAAFIPTITYIADSVGSQAQTLFIRALVMEEKFNLWHYLKREFMVMLGLSSTVATIVGVAITLFWQAPIIGIVLAISVFSTISIAITVGIGMPYFFTKIKMDPAIASGPLATIVRDLISILVYFSIAKALIV